MSINLRTTARIRRRRRDATKHTDHAFIAARSPRCIIAAAERRSSATVAVRRSASSHHASKATRRARNRRWESERKRRRKPRRIESAATRHAANVTVAVRRRDARTQSRDRHRCQPTRSAWRDARRSNACDVARSSTALTHAFTARRSNRWRSAAAERRKR